MSLALCWLPPEDLNLDPVPPFRSHANARTREALLAAVEQFQLEVAARYVARWIDDRGKRVFITLCNFAARDIAIAMGCAWPRMTANELFDWLSSTEGKVAGWRAVDVYKAEELANEGKPVVAVVKRSGHGHVAVGVPTPPGQFGLHVAQAGKVNFSSGPVGKGFGRLQFLCFAHV